MNNVSLKKASVAELKRIQEMAHVIWMQHYPEIIGINQINYMLNKMYSLESLSEQVESKKHEFYFILNGQTEVGFVSINKLDADTTMIQKFYINQLLAGKGVGTLAFKELLKQVSTKKIQLTVNRQNYKSINFYFKNGFKILHVADFDIGNGYVMNDFVMEFNKSEKLIPSTFNN